MPVCNACPRKCGALRENDIKSNGFCKMPYNAVLARASLHLWEEPPISGTKGSGAIFFSGCSLRCAFCQNYNISHEGFGKSVSTDRFIKIIKELEEQGAHNINLVNPTHFVPFIREALKIYKPSVPVVYNTGGYDSTESIRSLDGLIDIYLPDLKYFSPEKSKRYALATDYFENAETAVLEMKKQVGDDEFQDGLMKKGMIIRHLILPENTDESFKILEWIQKNLGTDTYISLMSQYTPCGRASDFPEINRKVMSAEYQKVINRFFDLGFHNGFMQERTSAKTIFIPPFDLTGV